jgi:hypothetical protein
MAEVARRIWTVVDGGASVWGLPTGRLEQSIGQGVGPRWERAGNETGEAAGMVRTGGEWACGAP